MDEEEVVAKEDSQGENLAEVEMEAREADPTLEIITIRMKIRIIKQNIFGIRTLIIIITRMPIIIIEIRISIVRQMVAIIMIMAHRGRRSSVAE